MAEHTGEADVGRATGRARHRREPPRVVIVGAGVSGCACAATLAEAGVPVTIVSNALDSFGLPSYGPVVCRGAEAVAACCGVLKKIPDVLRRVWVSAAFVPASGEPFVAVDRRMVSVETKRALERLDGLELRQALVTDVRAVSGGLSRDRQGCALEGARVSYELDTAFGEVLGADAVVFAPGLGVGRGFAAGMGGDSAGPYGRADVGGLRDALEGLGASFRETSARAERSYMREVVSNELWLGLGVAVVRVRRDVEGEGSRDAGRRTLVGNGWMDMEAGSRVWDTWPEEYPLAPHWVGDLWRELSFMVGEGDSERAGAGDDVGAPEWCLVPDGVASGEVYACRNGGEVAHEFGVATRLGGHASGLAVDNLATGGRLVGTAGTAPGVWVAGRASGAMDYLMSLSSGVEVARDVASWVADRGWGPQSTKAWTARR